MDKEVRTADHLAEFLTEKEIDTLVSLVATFLTVRALVYMKLVKEILRW